LHLADRFAETSTWHVLERRLPAALFSCPQRCDANDPSR
jgi:hypothetical protein